jgi:1-acyl-sn-glycerol-3-phosphate acyltransferase
MGRRILGRLNDIWTYVTVPLVFIVLVSPATLLALPFSVPWRLRIVGPFWRLFSRYTLHFACWSSLYEEDHRQPELRTNPPQGLYIANHQSFLDIPVIVTQFQVAPIMKKEVLYIPVLGIMGWAAGALVVSRGKRDSRKKVFVKARDRLVADRSSIQYYPEGTRSRDGKPKGHESLKVTLIHLAFESNIPVIPISIYGTHGILRKGGHVTTGKKLGIITHAAIYPQDYKDAKTFARAAWEQVLKGYGQLAEKLES